MPAATAGLSSRHLRLLGSFCFLVALICCAGAGYIFWIIAQPPLRLGLFNAVAPGSEKMFEPFLMIRKLAYLDLLAALGFIGTGVALWKRARSRSGVASERTKS